jgi:hypothetical protein
MHFERYEISKGDRPSHQFGGKRRGGRSWRQETHQRPYAESAWNVRTRTVEPGEQEERICSSCPFRIPMRSISC